ncbi:hypothetical protein O0L34_g15737 [Tuta absoluta]|nr:hypothetical protein O0L34_g15737 [Tuta absoluta]
MSKCGMCSKILTKRSPILTCNICDILVHAKTECTGLTNKQLSALRAVENLDWTCNECLKAGTRRASYKLHDVEDDEDEEGISKNGNKVVTVDHKEFMSDISKEIKKILKIELGDIQKSVTYVSNKLDECLESMELFKKRMKELENKNTYLTNKTTNMEHKILALEQVVAEFQQGKMDSTLEVAGIPKMQDENLIEIAESLSKILEVDSATKVQASRLPPHPKKPDVIVLKMHDKDTKMQWMVASRKKNITVQDVIPTTDAQVGSTPVYVREAMTPFNKKLFWLAKQELKPAFKYVWFKDGKILARKHDNGKITVLRNECDIENLLTKDE